MCIRDSYYSDNTMSVKIKDDVEIKREKMPLRAVMTVKAALEEVLENNKLKNENAINVLLTKKENTEEVITMPVSYTHLDVYKRQVRFRSSAPKKKRHRGMEQLAARRAHNPKVAGSNPAPATIRLRG